MTIDRIAIEQTLEAAAAEGRSSLLEHEVYAVLTAAGCRAPRRFLIPPSGAVSPAELAALGSPEVMLKIVSPEIAHKTDVGGVRRCAATPEGVERAAKEMLATVPARYAGMLEAPPGHTPRAYRGLQGTELEAAIRRDIRGVLCVERVPVEDEGIGSEVLVALRHNREFGPVLTTGVGGVDTELLAAVSRKGCAVQSASAVLSDESALLAEFRSTLAGQRLAGRTRGGRELVGAEAIARVFRAFRELGLAFGSDGEGEGWTITELEVNPFAASGGELVALDGLLRFRRRAPLTLPRPLGSLEAMLEPKSLAVVGVSAKGMNMGRIILRNVLAWGFDPARTYVVRPECEEIDGVRCVPRVRDLPEREDLFILAVGAEQVPDILEELVEHDRAVGVIIIPGGMAEKSGGQALEARVTAALRRARELGRPLVVNGGNCLGIVSQPGLYHTLFIPESRLPLSSRSEGAGAHTALISQSGACLVSRLSRLQGLTPRYAISTGNQTDLTVGDYLQHLSADPEVRTFAVYLEGFKDGDGLAFSRGVEKLVGQGRDVIFYKAGRTAEGKTASSGHTASLAGDYDVCEAIVRRAGAMVAGSFEEFLGLVKLSSMLGGKRWNGGRLAALSNAGYEVVGIADSLHGEGWSLGLASLAPETQGRLQGILRSARIDALGDVHNPLDVTPMAGDEVYEEAVRAFIADPGVDLVLCATVPLTPAMATLDLPEGEPGSWRSEGSFARRLARLVPQTEKPVVVSLDAGPLYDSLARAIEAEGIPVFRSADEAVRTMGRYWEALRGRTAR